MKWLTDLVLALAGVAAVVALREATLSTHEPVPPGSSVELVVAAHTRGAERSQGLDELVEAQLATCRLEINSDLIDVGPMPGGGADDRYRAVLEPGMDDTDRRQFRGCVEDWTIDHLSIDVISLEDPRAGRP
jgi:hypothetical protein